MELTLENQFVAPPGATVLALDVDGVLVHPTTGGQRWDSGLLKDLGIDPADLGRNFFGRYWSEVVVGRRDLRSALQCYLDEAQSPVLVDDLIGYWFEKDGALDHAVVNIATRWRSARADRYLVVVSNQEPYRAKYLMHAVGIGAIADGYLWSCRLGVSKSDPLFYKIANRDFLSGAQKVIFFDDEAKHVGLACEAGWSAHLFTDASEMADRLAAL